MPTSTREQKRWMNIKTGLAETRAAPMGLAPRMPKHCKKLIIPKTPPIAAPPGQPMAIAAMATGIMLKVMESPAG